MTPGVAFVIEQLGLALAAADARIRDLESALAEARHQSSAGSAFPPSAFQQPTSND